MPRFDGGAIDMRELLRRLAERIVNAVMDAEADQLCGGGANSRNGYRERSLATCVGALTPRIPKPRSGCFFPEDVVERHRCVDRALVAAVAAVAAVAEMHVTGTSTRKVQRVEGCCPRAAAVPEEAEPDALAYLDFPPTHWKRLRTNNVQERTNREIKRRSRVMQAFPSTGSLVRLAGAVMCEQDEIWQESRYFSGARMNELYDDGRTRGIDGPAESERSLRQRPGRCSSPASSLRTGSRRHRKSAVFQVLGRRAGSLRIGRYTNFLDTTDSGPFARSTTLISPPWTPIPCYLKLLIAALPLPGHIEPFRS